MTSTDTAMTHTEHTITMAVPPEAAFWIISDVRTWPVVFPPTVHAERIGGSDADERIQLWALANGEMKTWVSRRRIDRAAATIDFGQERTAPPVGAMKGTWSLRPVQGGCEAVLSHDFRAAGDDPASLALIGRAVEHNSSAELGSLKAAAEAHAKRGDLLMTFEDTELADGPSAAAYDFIYRAQDWPERLPHVARVALTEDTPGLQLMEMDTASPDGSVHTTVSGRVCFPGSRIVYKQTQVPPLLSAHCGEWRFEDAGGASKITSRHTVLINPDAVTSVLGDGATVEQAKSRVRESLSANSLTTMRHARSYAEGTAHPMRPGVR
jgi:aromatase